MRIVAKASRKRVQPATGWHCHLSQMRIEKTIQHTQEACVTDASLLHIVIIVKKQEMCEWAIGIDRLSSAFVLEDNRVVMGSYWPVSATERRNCQAGLKIPSRRPIDCKEGHGGRDGMLPDVSKKRYILLPHVLTRMEDYWSQHGVHLKRQHGEERIEEIWTILCDAFHQAIITRSWKRVMEKT